MSDNIPIKIKISCHVEFDDEIENYLSEEGVFIYANKTGFLFEDIADYIHRQLMCGKDKKFYFHPLFYQQDYNKRTIELEAQALIRDEKQHKIHAKKDYMK